MLVELDLFARGAFGENQIREFSTQVIIRGIRLSTLGPRVNPTSSGFYYFVSYFNRRYCD